MGVDAKMVVATNEQVTDEQIRRWSYLLASTLGRSTYWIDRDNNQHVLSRLTNEDYLYEEVEEYYYYHTTPTPQTVLNVNWLSRYYGPGYERGHLPDIITTALLLQRMIPNSTVLYGRDSGGTVEPIDVEFLLNHAANHGTGTYYTHGLLGDPVIMCEFCNEPMGPHTWSGGNIKYSCLGCNNTAEANRNQVSA